jgi:hypothetical protein
MAPRIREFNTMTLSIKAFSKTLMGIRISHINNAQHINTSFRIKALNITTLRMNTLSIPILT